ncbi:MAG: L-seryl-tRNA(Sec) selenium transferase [Candidatus Limnocylindrales bacterium]
MTATDRPRPPSVGRVLEVVRSRIGTMVRDADETGALTAIVRSEIEAERERLATGVRPRSIDDLADAVDAILDTYRAGEAAAPDAVINATGVVLHTNLGRAPWPEVAIQAARAAAATYGYLELAAETGRRGPRFRLAEDHLVALTGAEDALVVNNNAAAVAVAVGLAGPGGGVVVSRGELVEIGGSVRIPDIIERAGARLIEVGTTNRTRVADFERPLADGTATVVLRVHRSNFTMTGFIEEPDTAAVGALAHHHGAIVIDDLGSGALLDTAAYGLLHEPTPRERLALGADLVTFSGDKLVGGPQVGLIVGAAALVERLRRDPLARAMRPDKAILSAAAATLGLYRAGVAAQEIPIWRSIATPAAELKERAERIASMCAAFFVPDQAVGVVELRSAIGGGSLPGQTLASWGVAVSFASATDAATSLRSGDPAILARIQDDAVVFDLRTVEIGADGDIVRRIGEIAHGRP